jgi:polyhydroxybutyrate depolymerase
MAFHANTACIVPQQLLRPISLVIALHGYKGTAAGLEQYSGFSGITDTQGFLVAYPQALGETALWDLESGQTNLDVKFINALMDDLLARCPLDAAHIYVAGHSRGGGLAHRLACDLAPRIAAFAAVSGAFYKYQDCSPSRPVAVIAIHGLADQSVPFNGRVTDSTNLHATPPLPEWAASWASHDGCAPAPDTMPPEPDIKIDTWSHCQAQTAVELYTLATGGHAWPTDPINASQTIWDFFKLH